MFLAPVADWIGESGAVRERGRRQPASADDRRVVARRGVFADGAVPAAADAELNITRWRRTTKRLLNHRHKLRFDNPLIGSNQPKTMDAGSGDDSPVSRIP